MIRLAVFPEPSEEEAAAIVAALAATERPAAGPPASAAPRWRIEARLAQTRQDVSAAPGAWRQAARRYD